MSNIHISENRSKYDFGFFYKDKISTCLYVLIVYTNSQYYYYCK